ncbi:hypothetical protein [Alteromonas sp. BMJM2]|uniref:hypothetical protein n=1 Tax=Alteromonas sp. BMJM2 TaxID=2954241 RepID=UPI0022B3B0C8|nr:hypothetical protein [Alteromonas sp. BMJM2]
MLSAVAQFFHVITLLFTSAEDAAISLNKATGVMRSNVEHWEQTEKLKLQDKLAQAKAESAANVKLINKEKEA